MNVLDRLDFQVVRPGRVSDKGTGFNDPPFHSSTWNRTAFLGQIVCDQLSKASKARGKLLKAGEDPVFEPSWARYSRNMVDAIETVNQKIRDEAQYPNEAPAFMAIRHLLVLDLYLRRVLWRAHLRGTLAYVQHRGGIDEVLKLKQGPLYVNFAVEYETYLSGVRLIRYAHARADTNGRPAINLETLYTRIQPAQPSSSSKVWKNSQTSS